MLFQYTGRFDEKHVVEVEEWISFPQISEVAVDILVLKHGIIIIKSNGRMRPQFYEGKLHDQKNYKTLYVPFSSIDSIINDIQNRDRASLHMHKMYTEYYDSRIFALYVLYEQGAFQLNYDYNEKRLYHAIELVLKRVTMDNDKSLKGEDYV